MRQVIIVSLGNNAYHIEEDGYRALRTYLDRARSGLKNNPDAEEILGDLERAIAEKCTGALSDGKNVVTTEDIAGILQQMGPVVGDAAEEPPKEPESGERPPKTFRRRMQGSAIAGVCAGLADYFGIDALIVRLAFVGLTLISGGLPGIILYLVMAFVVPSDGGAMLASDWKFPGRPAVWVGLALLAVLGLLLLSRMFGPHHGFPFEILFMFLPFALVAFIALLVTAVIIVLLRFLRATTR
jgi:phage shock protein PspC (stress-responsive transcriptional regulator)